MARKKKEEVESVEEKKVETTAPKDAEKESKDANKKATEKKPKEKEVIVPEKKTEEKAAKVEVKPIEKATEASKQELTEEQKKAKEEEEKKLKELEAEEKKKKVEALKKAGSIHKQVMEFIKPMIKPGAKVLDICEAAEAKIVELGGMIGFPTNIAINEVAAHYTSPLNDETVINDGDVVKLDIGVAVDGWVADGAITINLNKTDRCKNLVLAVDTAIKAGLQLIKPGVLTKEVGKKTEEIIKQFGYHPISDLTGHEIKQYELHSGKIIPSTKNGPSVKFEEGEVYGFEVFASTGVGSVKNSSNTYIFSIKRYAQPKIRNKYGREILKTFAEKYQTLPFSEREVLKQYQLGRFGLKELIDQGVLYRHPVIREEGAYISQAEVTILITETGYELIC
jgi:methionyl aminopeptidase